MRRAAAFALTLTILSLIATAPSARAQLFWPFSSPTPEPQPKAIDKQKEPQPAKPKAATNTQPAIKQPKTAPVPSVSPTTGSLPAATSIDRKRDAVNQWVVGIAAGRIEGAPLRLAAELAEVTDDGDNLRVMPIVTRGVFENFTDILYLRGVDAAIVYGDAMGHYKTKDRIANIDNQVAYVANLFVAEMHVLARPGINSMRDLAGKKVNFNVAGTAAAFTGPLVFERLGINVVKQFEPQREALAAIGKESDVAAIVIVTTKPAPSLAQSNWPEGFRLIPVEYTSALEDYYVPANLDPSDYPRLIPEGQKVATIAVPVVLAAANAAAGSDRHRRLSRFVDRFVERLGALQKPPYDANWKSVNLAATVPGWKRFSAMQQKLGTLGVTTSSSAAAAVDKNVARKQAIRAAPDDAAEQEKLFQKFLEWNQGQPR